MELAFPVVMEFPFDVDSVISDRITHLEGGRGCRRVASSLICSLESPKRLQQLELIVDRMGVASAKVSLVHIALLSMLLS